MFLEYQPKINGIGRIHKSVSATYLCYLFVSVIWILRNYIYTLTRMINYDVMNDPKLI